MYKDSYTKFLTPEDLEEILNYDKSDYSDFDEEEFKELDSFKAYEV
jgi:hypothetical protein